MPRTCDFDCVVVGAGSAGIAAATRLCKAGLRVVILEALPRIGGRAFTQTFAGVPFDWGCHWLHSGSANILRRAADRLGVRYQKANASRRIRAADGWLDGASLAKLAAFHESSDAAAREVGEGGDDLALSVALPRSAQFSGARDFWISLTASFDAPDISVVDYVRYEDTLEDWPVTDGYGALIAQLARGLDIRLGVEVVTVRWDKANVQIETSTGGIRAKTVIVTASTNVLAAGGIDFDPPLPVQVQAALNAVPVGCANKFVYPIRGNPEAFPPSVHLLDLRHAPETCGVYSRPYGRPYLVAHTGGRYAGALERLNDRDASGIVMEQIVGLVGEDAARHLGPGRCSRWGEVPSIRGAYSSARPGEAHQRQRLSDQFDERVLLAGEASSMNFYSTAHGAHESGIAAAQLLMNSVLVDGRDG
ncbi:MAG: FAD-dependent oxidoreductase [Chromatiales bacterium]|nr:FAD-dependent oxidoreductase [Chromatiales bacterium]